MKYATRLYYQPSFSSICTSSPLPDSFFIFFPSLSPTSSTFLFPNLSNNNSNVLSMALFSKFFGLVATPTGAPILGLVYAVIGLVFAILCFGRCMLHNLLIAQLQYLDLVKITRQPHCPCVQRTAYLTLLRLPSTTFKLQQEPTSYNTFVVIIPFSPQLSPSSPLLLLLDKISALLSSPLLPHYSSRTSVTVTTKNTS